MKLPLLGILCTSLLVATFPTGSGAADQKPKRHDVGSLIVLDVYGSYYEMGRQQARLLGETGREVVQYQTAAFDRGTANLGFGFEVFGLEWYFNGIVGPHLDRSGFYDETRGILDELGLGRSGGRFMLGAFFGSTALLATRSATADRGALMVRNVDFSDGYGRRRPTLVRYHPNDGDMQWMSLGWPFVGSPIVGLNEAGLAFSFNNWVPKDVLGSFLPQSPYRLVMEKAQTVAEAIEIFRHTRSIQLAGLFSLADAQGNIALLECTASECSVYQPPHSDWFAVTNHARTETMKKLDQGATEDSYIRLAAVQKAAEPVIGRLNRGLAVGILRDRPASGYVNDSCVGKLSALDSAIVRTASRTMWVSTTMEPFAPFGEFVPFTFGDAEKQAPIPADVFLGSPEMNEEAQVVRDMRSANRLFASGDIEAAGKIWDRIEASHLRFIDPYRLAWARARVLWTEGRLREARDLLSQADAPGAPFEVRAFAKAMKGVLADRLGERDQALSFYQDARNYLAANSSYKYPFDDVDSTPLRVTVDHGLKAPLTTGAIPKTPDLQQVPD